MTARVTVVGNSRERALLVFQEEGRTHDGSRG